MLDHHDDVSEARACVWRRFGAACVLVVLTCPAYAFAQSDPALNDIRSAPSAGKVMMFIAALFFGGRWVGRFLLENFGSRD
jgi:hypothetical protein